MFIKISIFKTFYLFFLAKDKKYALLAIVKSDKKSIIMKKSCHAFRVVFCSVMIMAMSLSMIAQRSMSLGDLKFVLPSADMQMASRTFDIKVATTGITSSMFRTICGVAFVQTAVPSFEIDGLELSCDIASNSANVAINDTVYELPLEVWQLQSIVNFADAESNAAMTLCGNGDCPIKYHKAFIDNLMGLRLLQVDLSLSKQLLETEVGMFPTIYGEYILSPNERIVYENGIYKNEMLSYTEDALYAMEAYGFFDAKSILDAVKEMSYEELSGVYYSTVVISELMMYEMPVTDVYSYIYTDYGQPINFSSVGQNIVFEGSPYYLFAHWANDDSDAVIGEEWTSICKQMSDIIFLINPIVYDSAIKCCQWSAFFRYVKENYPDEWRSFKADVRRLKYDAPEVVTPINFYRDEP